MIQRFQSLWLLLAAIFAFLTFKLPFYSGSKIIKNIRQPDVRLDAVSQILILVLTGIVILLCFMAIFLYKNRKRQLTLTIINCVLSIILIVLYFLEIQKFETGIISLVLPFYPRYPHLSFSCGKGHLEGRKTHKKS